MSGRGRYPRRTWIDDIKIKNAVYAQPGDDLAGLYAWLTSSARDGQMGALAWNNRRILILSPGFYPTLATWTLATSYVDVVSLTGDPASVIIEYDAAAATPTITQSAADVRLQGLTLIQDHANGGPCLQLTNEKRGTGTIAAFETLTATGAGIGIREAGDTNRPDLIYMWNFDTLGDEISWHDITTVTDDNTLVIDGYFGLSGSANHYSISPQQSTYTDLLMLTNGNAEVCGSLGHFGGTWTRCKTKGGTRAFNAKETTNDTDILEGQAGNEATTPETVSFALTAHTVGLRDAISFASTTNYKAGKYEVTATTVTGDNEVIMRAPFNAENLTGIVMTIYRAEHTALMVDCEATGDFAFIGDLNRGSSGTFIRCKGEAKAFGACTSWGSPILAEAVFEDCEAGTLSYALGVWIAGKLTGCTATGGDSFAGSAGADDPGYIKDGAILDGCVAATDGFGQGVDDRNRCDGLIKNCQIGTAAQYLDGTNVAKVSSGTGKYINNIPAIPINSVTGDSPVTISAFYNGATYTSTGAAGAIIYNLPPAVVGLRVPVQRSDATAGSDININPDGAETMDGIDGNELVANTKELTNTADDTSNVVLECFTDGVWTVVSSSDMTSWVST